MIQEFLGVKPRFDDTNYIAPSADLIGDVRLGKEASVWFNVTIRADVNWIRIGKASNIQDNTVIHVSKGVAPTRIGNGVTVGHSAVVHGCTVEDDVLIGMGAVILDHAIVGHDTIIGARALITQRTVIPARSLVLGAPAQVVRPLSDEEVASIRVFKHNYLRYSAIYRGIEKPSRNPFYEPLEENSEKL